MPLVEDRAGWLEALCARPGVGRVAHLGCADSPYTRELLDAGALLHARLLRVADVTGFDVDADALALLRDAFPGRPFVHADVSTELPHGHQAAYDLVVAGEVLEHVPDADLFLRGCGRLLRPGGRLCVTVPNACCPKIGARALAGGESVHPDHRTYYGPRTLARTLDGAGYELETICTCFPPVVGTGGRLVVNPILRLSHRLFQGPVGDGLIAVASARSNASAIAS